MIFFYFFSGAEMSIKITSPITGQFLVVPVKAAFRADQCANIEIGWSSLLYFIAAHYQSLLFIVASCIVCVFITKFVSQATNKSRYVSFLTASFRSRSQKFRFFLFMLILDWVFKVFL